MTAAARPLGDERPAAIERDRLPGPREGWTSLFLITAMLAIVALAIDDSNWAGTGVSGGNQTSFLPLCAVLAVLVGAALAKTRLHPVTAHAIGAVAAVVFLFVAVSAAISDASTLGGRLRWLAESAEIFYNDTVVLGIRSSETSAFLLTLGATVWTTGQFAAFNIFRRGRAMTAVLVTGFVLLVNVSVTVQLQYPYLILFCAAGLLLLVRMNLFHQSEGWQRRRIGDARHISHVFMRGGWAFVTVALIGSLVLATYASSAPLANVWRDLDDQLLSWGLELNRWVGGVTGPARGVTGFFGSTQTIRNFWESSSEVVFNGLTSDDEPYYWRAAAYEDFDGRTWSQRRTPFRRIPPGEALLAGTQDALADDAGRREVTASITAVSLAGGTLLAPESPLVTDREVDVLTSGPGGPYASIELIDWLETGESYTVTSLVREDDPDLGGVTEADLARTPALVPPGMEQYVGIRPGSIGELTHRAAQDIVDDLPDDERDAYHIADAIEGYLHDTGGFSYQTDVRGMCGRESLVECFLRERRGYCEHFAAAMVMMLRTQQIPAREVMGYLPGQQQADGTWVVDRSAAHAWVEVFFPTYGWVAFDPTPGNQENGQRTLVLAPGDPNETPDPNATPTPRPTALLPPQEGGPEVPPPGPASAVPGAGGTDAGRVGLFAVAFVIALSAIVVLVFRLRRTTITEPDLAYRGIARLASRFGYGPRPTQTAYEYATSLGEVVPRVREELHVVAHAKVVTTYARRPPQGAALVALRDAYRRVRLGLFRLVFRRGPRGGRR
jgi:transglutaminase-like putative cysteine protease